jgi:hypothetical protein
LGGHFGAPHVFKSAPKADDLGAREALGDHPLEPAQEHVAPARSGRLVEHDRGRAAADDTTRDGPAPIACHDGDEVCAPRLRFDQNLLLRVAEAHDRLHRDAREERLHDLQLVHRPGAKAFHFLLGRRDDATPFALARAGDGPDMHAPDRRAMASDGGGHEPAERFWVLPFEMGYENPLHDPLSFSVRRPCGKNTRAPDPIGIGALACTARDQFRRDTEQLQCHQKWCGFAVLRARGYQPALAVPPSAS